MVSGDLRKAVCLGVATLGLLAGCQGLISTTPAEPDATLTALPAATEALATAVGGADTPTPPSANVLLDGGSSELQATATGGVADSLPAQGTAEPPQPTETPAPPPSRVPVPAAATPVLPTSTPLPQAPSPSSPQITETGPTTTHVGSATALVYELTSSPDGPSLAQIQLALTDGWDQVGILSVTGARVSLGPGSPPPTSLIASGLLPPGSSQHVTLTVSAKAAGDLRLTLAIQGFTTQDGRQFVVGSGGALTVALSVPS